MPDEPASATCRQILDLAVEGRLAAETSTAVLEEVLHVELRSTKADFRGVAGLAYAMLTPLLPVTDETVKLALDLDLAALGANDRLHVATCTLNDIDAIVSADRGFDVVPGLRRVDPLDANAVATALADHADP